MSKIKKHPVLEVPVRDRVIFKYNGQEVEGEKGYTIAAALHRAGFPVHSHSLDGRERSLECGIGKCGACENVGGWKNPADLYYESGWGEGSAGSDRRFYGQKGKTTGSR